MHFPGYTPRRNRNYLSIPWITILACIILPTITTAWPYVDCTGENPVFAIGAVTAYFDSTSKMIVLGMQGNFTNMYQYPVAETSQWRSSIVVKVLDNQLHRSEGPACNIFAGGCPVAPGPGVISTNFSIDQSAPFVELSVDLQIKSASDQTIVCTGILLEQRMDGVNTAVSYLPLALALYSGSISLASIILRATEEYGIIGSLATYGLASTSEIISVHTPGLFDIIFYAQFMVMTGQLSLNYPSFYVTFSSLFHWSFLEFRNSFAGKGPENSTYVLEYGGAGSVNQIDGPIVINDNANAAGQKRSLEAPWSIENYSPLIPTPTPTPSVTTSASTVTSPPKHMPTTEMITLHFQKRQASTTSDPSHSSTSSTSPPASPSVPSSSSNSSTVAPSVSPSSTSPKPKPKTTTTKPTNTTIAATTTVSPTLIIPTLTDPFNLASVKLKQYNVSRFGMDAYAAAIGVYPSDLFLGTLINTIIAAGVSLFISAFLLTVAWSMAKDHLQKERTLQHAFNFVTGNLVRVWSLFYTPLALSAMYQLTLTGNTTMMAVATASLVLFSVGVTIILTWRILRASGRFLLFKDQGMLLKYGVLYNTLAEEGTLFFLVNLLVRFLWGLSISMLSSYGVAQVSVLLVVEFGYLLVIGFKWPYLETGDSKFHLFLGFMRIVVTGCSIAYVPSLDVPAKTRQVFAYSQMALHLGVLIIMFSLILWNTIQVYLFWQSRHTHPWKGSVKSYNLNDPAEDSTNWSTTSRPRSRITDPGMLRPTKSRQYTVQPYSSVGDLGALSEDNLISGGSPAYRHSHLHPGYRQSRFPPNNKPVTTFDLHSDSIVPLSSSPAPISIQSVTSLPHSPSTESIDGPVIPLQPTQLSAARSQAPRESYAKIQRMTHQQGPPDLRSRRMSEIFRDGGYLYEPGKKVDPKPEMTQDKPNILKSLMGSVGSFFTLSKRSVKRPMSIGTKPKAFEVIRPPRHPPVMETEDDTSQVGDELKELNSIGISRFFQESGLNNDRKGNLFVANPEVGLSRNGSVRSSVSGFPQTRPELDRNVSGRSITRPMHSTNMSTDLNSIYSGLGSVVNETGILDGRRVSTTSVQHNFSRVSLESNIADVLRSETPFRLQGGGIIKVSKGPEKSVQYWHKGTGQSIESNNSTDNIERKQSPTIVPPMPSPIILLPTSRGTFFDNIQVDTNKSTLGPNSVKGRAESRPESPTESLHSTNVTASAGKMHEILDRMFSDQDDDDSDTISDGGESCSTFSGRVSATILALQQKQELEEYLADAQSVYRAEVLEPVMERRDLEADGEDNGAIEDEGTTGRINIPQKLSRSPSGTIMRSLSGSSKLASSPPTSISRPSKNSLSGRPLAQTPLHSPTLLSFTGSTASLLLPGTLSRQSSRTSLGDSLTLTKQEPEAITSLEETQEIKVLGPLQEESVEPLESNTNTQLS